MTDAGMIKNSMSSQLHFHQTFRQVNERTWIVGGKVLIKLTPFPTGDKQSWPAGGTGGEWYSASPAPATLPKSSPISGKDAATKFKLLRNWGEEGAEWQVGLAVLKVRLTVDPQDAKEADTLTALQGRPLSFSTPVVYADWEFDGWEYLIHSKIPGVPISKVWKTLDWSQKDACAIQVARCCRELAAWGRDRDEGVGAANGSRIRDWALLEHYFSLNNSPQTLLDNCEAMCLDTSEVVFAHNAINPEFIMVSLPSVGGQDVSVVGFEDWSRAGFVPEQWIRPSCCLSNGLGLDWHEALQAALECQYFVAPDLTKMLARRSDSQKQRQAMLDQYLSTTGSERKQKAERLILDVTGGDPGACEVWDKVEAEDELYSVSFSVLCQMRLGTCQVATAGKA